MLKALVSKIYVFCMSSYYEHSYSLYRKKYDIHPSFRFNGLGICFYGDGEIHIGENSYIGQWGSIQAFKDMKVTIGRNCRISHFVLIYTCNANADSDFSDNEKVSYKKGNVTIGDNCWIGAHVFIKEGITIGNNVVIGANSIVTKNIPDYAVAGGVPARVIRYKDANSISNE